jgi:hypothetical protein
MLQKINKRDTKSDDSISTSGCSKLYGFDRGASYGCLIASKLVIHTHNHNNYRSNNMIDRIAAIFSVIHEPFGDVINNIKIKTNVERAYRKEFALKNGSSSLMVKSGGNGKYIKISGNFAKFLQKHNIFGTNNLRGLCADVVPMVLNQLGVSYTDAEMQDVINGNFIIKEVDIAGNFRSESCDETPLIIREIERHWRDLGKNVSNYGVETVYLNQYSKDLSLKFYDKRKQLSDCPLPVDIPQRDRLLKYAEGLVRAELTLGADELKRRGLGKGSSWTVDIAKTLLNDEIAESGIYGSIKRLLLPDEYDELPRKLKITYRLWLLGDAPKSILEEQTYRNHRNSLKLAGIDINHAQPKERIVDVDMKSLLSPENMLNFPKFARECGLVHIPVKKENNANH